MSKQQEYKTYERQRRTSRSSISVNYKGENRFVTFTSVGYGSAYYTGFPCFATGDTVLQEAIEATDAFKSGDIKLLTSTAIEARRKEATGANDEVYETPSPPAVNEKVGTAEAPVKDDGEVEEGQRSFPGVTTFREAREILRGEPFNVEARDVPNKDGLFKKAAELGVTFPDLKA